MKSLVVLPSVSARLSFWVFANNRRFECIRKLQVSFNWTAKQSNEDFFKKVVSTRYRKLLTTSLV